MQVAVIGGGAAGYFAAIAAAEAGAGVIIYEAAQALAKVRISGGGRCNVTTAIQDPRELVTYYPRGSKELLGPFRRFGPRDTVRWYADRGVVLKTEPDGRLFPVTDDSATIIECLQGSAENAGVVIQRARVESISHQADGCFALRTSAGAKMADKIILTTGGGKAGQRLAAALGHSIVTPVPSIFTFTIKESWLTELSGASVQAAQVSLRVADQVWKHQGPVLITHWGVSGPAVLRLSAFAARALADCSYRAQVTFDWTGNGAEALRQWLGEQRNAHGRALVTSLRLDTLPQRLTRALVQRAGVPNDRRWSELSKSETQALLEQFTACPLPVVGKGVFKEEFVTAGGVAREEIDWRTMGSRVCPGCHIAGELLDIDGVTGGFNFQAAWTTGYLAGQAVAQ